MADVDDPRFSRLDAPIDQIWVPPDRKDTCLFNFGKTPDLWMPANQRDRPMDGSFDVSCTLWAALVKGGKDIGKVAGRSRSIADPHTPWRFQSASISASGTNSPRRACSSSYTFHLPPQLFSTPEAVLAP